jgi:hypothetical protein
MYEEVDSFFADNKAVAGAASATRLSAALLAQIDTKFA